MVSGFPKKSAKSKLTPVTIKKIGIMNPNPIPSNLTRRFSTSLSFSYFLTISETIIPAMNAPNTKCIPELILKTVKATISKNEALIASCPLLCIVSRINFAINFGFQRFTVIKIIRAKIGCINANRLNC